MWLLTPNNKNHSLSIERKKKEVLSSIDIDLGDKEGYSVTNSWVESPFRRFRRSLGDFCNSSLYLLKEELGSQIDIGFP